MLPRTQRQKEQLLASGALSPAEHELLSRVESVISYADGMYKGDGAHYFNVGLSAIHCIEEALAAAQIASVNNILDMPCGYGRVLRKSPRSSEVRAIVEEKAATAAQ